MAYGIRNLRQQNLMGGYDQLTPGAQGGGMNYSDNYSLGSEPEAQPSPGLAAVGNQGGYSLGSEPEVQREQGPIQTPTVEPIAAPAQQGRSLKETIDAINAGYTPDYTSRDRNNRLLDAAPERGAPGWARAIAASALSVKAQDPIATAEKVMYAPYMRDVEDWKTKADPYYKAAELENRQNVNERTLVSNAVTADAAQRRLEEQQRNNDMRNEQATMRNRAYAYSQRLGKGWDWDLSGPTAKKINKSTGEIIDTGMQTGKMDEETKIELQNEGRIAAATAAGGQIYNDPNSGAVRVNPRIPGDPAVKVPGTTGPVRTPGASQAGAGTTSQLEKNRVEQEIMKQQRATDPASKAYMKPDGKGGYTWGDRPVEGSVVNDWFGSGIGGRTVTADDVKKYDEYRKEANPEYVPRIKGLGPGKTPIDDVEGNPTVKPGEGIAGGTGDNYKLRKNPKNPNEMARSMDGGKTWQKSVDGGKTWR